MDGWNEVYTDSGGIRRCSRCQHARPTQLPDNSVSSRATTASERATNLGTQINQLISGSKQIIQK